MEIVEVVASEAGVDPLDLDRPLAEVIDTDALDVLYRDGTSATVVEFTYLGYRVTVGRDCEVSVSAADG